MSIERTQAEKSNGIARSLEVDEDKVAFEERLRPVATAPKPKGEGKDA